MARKQRAEQWAGHLIAGNATGLVLPEAVATDSGGNIYVAGGAYPGTVLVYANGASGNVAPIATIAGQ